MLVFTIVNRTSKTAIFVAGFSADEIKRRVIPFIGLRDPVVTDTLKTILRCFLTISILLLITEAHVCFCFFILIIVSLGIFAFRIFMAPGCNVSKANLDLYATSATFYANFYSAEPCVALTALCFMLVGEVI